MKIRFKKSKGAGALSGLIDLFSGARGYCHVELEFDNQISYSSDSADGGTRYKRIIYNPQEWDTYEFYSTSDQEAIVDAFCESELGSGYDWRGVLNFRFPWEREHPDKWFCSEVVVAALHRVGLLTALKPHKTSPNSLWKYLRENYLV